MPQDPELKEELKEEKTESTKETKKTTPINIMDSKDSAEPPEPKKEKKEKFSNQIDLSPVLEKIDEGFKQLTTQKQSSSKDEKSFLDVLGEW